MKSHFLLDPEIAYLNHGSFGACPRPVFEAYQRYQRELETEPVTFLQRRFPDLIEAARTALAGVLSCENENLAFVRNATYGLNLAARSLPLKPGDVILTTDKEYGAVDRMWQAICESTGANLVRVPIPLPAVSSDALYGAIAAHITPSVRALSFSHISAETAIVFPAKKLASLARDSGIISVVDGAHAPGQIPVDLPDIGADLYIGNCHKWLLSPKGAAFVYASPGWVDRTKPLSVSWGKFSHHSTALAAENDWQGTADISPFLAVADAIAFRNSQDWPAVVARCSTLMNGATPGLLALTKQQSIYGTPELRPPQMASFRIPSIDHAHLHRTLFEKYKVDIPVFKNPDGIFLRISLQAYNTPDNLARLTNALKILENSPF